MFLFFCTNGYCSSDSDWSDSKDIKCFLDLQYGFNQDICIRNIEKVNNTQKTAWLKYTYGTPVSLITIEVAQQIFDCEKNESAIIQEYDYNGKWTNLSATDNSLSKVIYSPPQNDVDKKILAYVCGGSVE